ncbi:hypothetical protein OIU80_00020 [Flavobacterium sp. LS1R47]|jgi:hypothetical protein|uniref:Uncharacterized protein n=1 Tax=Flavobacterium frigoritolerans TaxID=2987686 RepID=A0A9X2ZIZ9_9FLAO|nr:hypothetical protein [Flavobacterium frigoritolerans]MCV9930652.1 hypothetical protein [Flavobacterium frigoritolerans]
MIPITIQFNAYIPKNLGKSLLSYFEHDSRFNPNKMANYYQFRQKIQEIDAKGYAWLPEPGNFVSDYYFSTDKIDFHNKHNDHHNRLSLIMNLDATKTGNYSLFDMSTIFKHKCGATYKSGQHSDASHRVEAHIQTVPIYYGGAKTGSVPSKIEYKGVCEKILVETSDEVPLEASIQNTLSGTHISRVGAKIPNNTSIIKASASAGYPFTPGLVTPNIDFTIKATMYRNGKTLLITINGEHNHFPAYELVIDGKLEYNYNPVDNGYTNGPTPNNLSQSKTFTKTIYKQLTDWDIKSFNSPKQFNFSNKKAFGF